MDPEQQYNALLAISFTMDLFVHKLIRSGWVMILTSALNAEIDITLSK